MGLILKKQKTPTKKKLNAVIVVVMKAAVKAVQTMKTVKVIVEVRVKVEKKRKRSLGKEMD